MPFRPGHYTKLGAAAVRSDPTVTLIGLNASWHELNQMCANEAEYSLLCLNKLSESQIKVGKLLVW